jgi:hypothetical protein
MKSTDQHYQSYLLRLWRTGDDGPWRATLEDTLSSERHSFADVESLYAYLRQQMSDVARSPSRARKEADE